MRTRILAVLAAAVAVQLAGCSRLCRCCRHDCGPDRIPPAAVDRLPPPAQPSASGAAPAAGNKLTGAYGGSDS